VEAESMDVHEIFIDEIGGISATETYSRELPHRRETRSKLHKSFICPKLTYREGKMRDKYLVFSNRN